MLFFYVIKDQTRGWDSYFMRTVDAFIKIILKDVFPGLLIFLSLNNLFEFSYLIWGKSANVPLIL